MNTKLVALLFLSLYLFSCSTSNSDEPNIEIVGIYINGGETNYFYQTTMPLLNVGDYVDIGLGLSGNGSDLKTFMVKNEFSSYVKTTMWFQADEISDEFSDIPNGIIGFVDGVNSTGITVKAQIKSIREETITLSFFLFSKAPDSMGASVDIILKLGVPE